MSQTTTINQQLIDQFNDAATLAREGSHERAVRVWDQIINHNSGGESPPAVAKDFLGQAHMRKAWSLMDLNQYREAKLIFESEFMRSCLANFDLKVLFDYFFSFGNTLGELGDIAGMDDKFARALNIAADEGDAYNAQLCWLNLMHYAEVCSDWEYLERESRSCIQFADNSDLPKLALAAGLKRATALFKLGNAEKALKQAQRVNGFAKQLGEPEAIRATEELLARLNKGS